MTLLLIVIGLVGHVLGGELAGAGFVAFLLGYIIFTYFTERQGGSASAEMHAAEADMARPGPRGLIAAGLLAAGGLALTIFGARFLVTGAIDLASGLGVSETVIGLTIVAVGTSLPELVTSIVAAARGQTDVAFGNIVGSNIYNVLGILGVTALVQPIPVPPEIARLDIWVMLAATAALLVVTVTGWRITRREGGLMLGGYAAYLGFLVANV